MTRYWPESGWQGTRRAVRGPVAWDNARLAELEEELCRRHEAEASQDTAS